MNGKYTLFIDQYGFEYFCKYVKDLKNVHNLQGKVRKMYTDGKDGKTYHVGYVVGKHWLTAYKPYRNEVTR
jgi:hypothetical protein